MKKLLLSILLLLTANLTFSQAVFQKIIEKKYTELPVKIRKENSGIFGISSFDVKSGNVFIKDFDSPGVYNISSESLMKQTAGIKEAGKDFITGVKLKLPDLNKAGVNKANIVFKKSFLFNKENVLLDNGGILTDKEENKITIAVKSRNLLEIDYGIPGFKKTFSLNFNGNLAYADLIGIDSKGNSFLIIEKYLQEIPLKVQREIYTLSSEGNILSVLEVPSIKYLYTVRDFQIDAEGNLYQLLSDKEKITIIKWSGLTNYTKYRIHYPSEYNYELNFNDLTPTREYQTTAKSNIGIQSVSRRNALLIAETYALYKYKCTSSNLAPNTVSGPDGDLVKTPSWLVVGYNARIPYMWGGFNTVSQFSAGMANGKFAGDINTNGVSRYAVGVDCSGFVSRCWQLSYHSSTSAMPSITTQYASWDDLKPGDAIHKVGHVRLFVSRTADGAFRIVEASARNWDVSYWTYTPSDLSAYTPRYYTGMANDYSLKQPKLISVKKTSQNNVEIKWNCDTSDVKGYRLYKSTNGINWTVIRDENFLTSLSTIIEMNDSAEYYRVSSILKNPPYFSESSWSNVLGAGMFKSSKKVLIVDGFNRQSGDWRGEGTTFAASYGKAIAALNLNFESVKNALIIDSLVNLKDYDAVFWMLGDESTADETFDLTEQKRVKNYLENGGCLFTSGSEIGWDLVHKGTASDASFYTDFLKASYLADDSGSDEVEGVEGTVLEGVNFYYGQTFAINYPDEISTAGGSTLCLRYANNKGAGIEYTGKFGASDKTGKIIYLGFPLETTADDSAFNLVIQKSADYFFPGITSVNENNHVPLKFSLSQNYPNPFNPSTTIEYSVPSSSFVTIKIYNSLGQEVRTIMNEVKNPGQYSIKFDGSKLSSGIYFYRMQAGSYINVKKLILVK